MTEEQIKYFTQDEANRTLPYVRPIVADIVRAYEGWRAGVERYEELAGPDTTGGGESEAQEALRDEVELIAQQINGYLDELASVGCVFKGFDDGLVDFYSKRDGRDVFLCWKLGESEISYWHELDAGVAGRQPLVPELIKGESE